VFRAPYSLFFLCEIVILRNSIASSRFYDQSWSVLFHACYVIVKKIT